ncbi:ubiquinol-cytochrome c reductase iron-sulfur subunit [Raineyella sp. LH-20]|uniref:cytochrome bc1 complex Rieske iron-sulfur subunit n=1 Tax=Raineyella sp. LH-20 TaxID=3081204 RepID=UPI0029537F43|nr:Rieske 2Fe-2S domain-containing protein [Raineyella sp. LH-20]WOP17607.1 Rieske 2Fe-2S domain-containing protein [Raineyella sp. LH-20]
MNDNTTNQLQQRPVDDPGLGVEAPSWVSTNPHAAKHAEGRVVVAFAVSALSALASVVAYFAIPLDVQIKIGSFHSSLHNVVFGTTMGLAIFLIGVGAVTWGRNLMDDDEVAQERHAPPSSEEARTDALVTLSEGIRASGVARRKVILASLGGALGLFALPLVVTLADMGPWPTGRKRAQTIERTIFAEATPQKPIRLVNDITWKPIKAADVEIGQLINAQPENLQDYHEVEYQQEKAKSSIILVRMDPASINIPASRKDWQVSGILCYSKICTHVGCPITLWEQQTHHLLCPCHQSTFDLGNSGRVVFGPAARSLPQLKIGVDTEGYLIATQDFTVPVGPSFFERDSRNDFQEGDA